MHASNKQPTIILVKPQMGENIGSAARAMLNFGLENMRIVAAKLGVVTFINDELLNL